MEETEDIQRLLGEISENEYNIYYYKVYENLSDDEIAKNLNISINSVIVTMERIRKKINNIPNLKKAREDLRNRILALKEIRLEHIEKLKKQYTLLDIKRASKGRIYVEIMGFDRDSGARWKRIDLCMNMFELENYSELPGKKDENTESKSHCSPRYFAKNNIHKKNAQISGFKTRRKAALQQKEELVSLLKEAGIEVIDSLEIFEKGEEEYVNDR